MIPSHSAAVSSIDPNSMLSKAEIERHRRARVNAALDKLKMFHLTRSPNNNSKLEKISVMDQTISYLKSISNEQNTGAEKIAYDGYRNGFHAARQATAFFTYKSCDPNIAGPLVAAISAALSSRFDQAFKALEWLPSVYDKVDEEKYISSETAPDLNLSQSGPSTSFMPLAHSTPDFRFWNIPPLFDSPESANRSNSSSSKNNSRSLTLSLSLNDAEDHDKLSLSNGSTGEFVCVTCEKDCNCESKLPKNCQNCSH